MIINGISTRRFLRDENLLDFICTHIPSLHEQDILIVTSKIVALSEGRYTADSDYDVFPSLVEQEGEVIAHTKHVTLTIKDGMLMANAGIDRSNAEGGLVLLPRDSFASAEKIWNRLRVHFGVKEIGVVIADSRTYPMRKGVVGCALGYAGISGVFDYTGTNDLDGRTFQFESTNIADCIATAGILEMGEGAEQTPLAVASMCRHVVFQDKVDRREVSISPEDDMYLPIIPKNR